MEKSYRPPDPIPIHPAVLAPGMVFSPPVRASGAILFAILLAAGFFPPPATAQSPGDPEPPVILSRGTATVEAEGRRVEIPVSTTPSGPLFALAPLAELLGGELAESLRGQGYTLRAGDREFLLGPGSDRLVSGEQISVLSQPPIFGEGRLQVPLDLLEHTFGEIAGYDFSWDAGSRRLLIDRLPRREIPVSIEPVDHSRGVTRVVFRFREGAPRYRIHDEEGRVEVEILGDRLVVRDPTPPIDDPLVRRIEFQPSRIVLELVPEAQAASYVLRKPFRLVFDIRRETLRPLRASPPVLVPPQPRSGLRTIVIDPGHGGSETGAIGKNGAVEKNLTLILAEALARRLGARLPGVKVLLTRREDANLPLATRTAIANQNKGDLFISIHLNSYRGGPASGAETYFLNLTASDQQAASTAELENAPEDSGDPLSDLQLILWDLAQSQYLAESQRLGNLIQEELNTTLGLRDRGVKQAPFAVLMGAAMPAVLVELGFLSNPAEEAKLLDPAHRAQLVEAMVRAIARYRAQLEGPDAQAAEEEP